MNLSVNIKKIVKMTTFDWLNPSWATCADEAPVTLHLTEKNIISAIMQSSEHFLITEPEKGENFDYVHRNKYLNILNQVHRL